MTRKDFIKGSCGVCMALGSGFVMSAVLEACKTPLGVIKTSSKENVVTIPAAEFEKTNYKLVRVSNYNFDLAVQKYPDGTYKTLVLMCTHASQPLTRTGQNYYCTLHGSQFNHEGGVTKGPADRNMMQLNTSITNDLITIHLKQI